MKLFTSKMLEQLMSGQKKKSEGLLPEIVKRLIRSSCQDLLYIRAPEGDDIWAPGYDGIVANGTKTPYVAQGKSVWEFGTNTDSLAKINSDYKKRTERPLGIEKAEAVFYLVVPKLWAYDTSLTEWEAEHREGWKAVYVYDAAVLCDWLNSEPAVCMWLMQQYLEIETVEMDSVSGAWEQFAQRTNPPLSYGMFQIGREEQLETFRKRVNETICRVAAESCIEAYGFCLSALLQDTALAEQVTVLYNETTYRQLDGLCENACFLLLFPYHGPISRRNRVILCEGKGIVNENAIWLPRRWKTQHLQALQEMGIDHAEANELYSYTHGNLPALIRKIPGNVASLQPEWGKIAGIDLLQPLVLLRKYNTMDLDEQQRVSRLAGTPYAEVEQKYAELLRMDDSPLQKIDGWYQIVNDEEAWLALNMDIESAVGQRMKQEILTALSSMTAVRDYKKYDVLQQLLQNYIYFAENGSAQREIDAQVREILSFFHAEGCEECLMNALRTLAEAAPAVVLEFLQKEQLGSRKEVLWALNVLVEQEDECRAACQMLYRLAVSEAQGKWERGEAKQSLLDALCLWSGHTALTLQDKRTLVLRMLQNTPDFGVEFGIELVQKRSLLRGHRRGKKERPQNLIDQQELCEVYGEIARAVYGAALQNRWLGQIEKLLKGYRQLEKDALLKKDVLLEMAAQFDAAAFSPAELVPLQNWLRTELCNSREWERPDWTEVMEAWVRCTEPNDPIVRFGWMFWEWSSLPAEELLKGEKKSWRKKVEQRECIRAAKFTALKTEFGMDAVLRLLETMKDQYMWGVFLAKNTTREEFSAVAEMIRAQKKQQLLAGFFDQGDFREATAVFEKLSEAEKLQLLSALRREEVDSWLTTPEREQAYWTNQNMKETYNEQQYQKLLQYHPGGFLPYLYDKCEEVEQKFDLFREVFEAIAEKGVNSQDQGDLSDIIREVDKRYDADAWARCCLPLYKKGLLRELPQCLQRFFFRYPEEMMAFLKEDLSFRFNAEYYYELPEKAYQDKQAFDCWAEYLYPEFTDVLGHTLGRSGKGSDGIFPHEFVREFLEEKRDETLIKSVLYGKLNSRGARIVLDGRTSHKQAETYQAQARKLEWDYPQSAEILKQLAQRLESESQRDRLAAEITP